MQELAEKTLAHYTIQRCLARGGMSHVYLARDEQTQRAVAIKVVHASEDEHFARFQREVKTLSALHHEHILPVIESGVHGPWYYYIMPYIEYGTLRDRLLKGPLTPEEAGQVLSQIAAALQFAHDHGILHRDIKPSNILLKDEQHVYLADFGLAKNINENSTITQSGCLMGTPEYMAPELAELPATTSSDIYAVGILLYQMLTGRVPFKGSTPLSIYWKHIKEQPTPPSQLNPAISFPVEQVVLHALQKEPHRRFKTVQTMALAYTRALQTSDQGQLARSQDTQPFHTIALPPPTQRVIPIPLLAGSSRRHVHQALAALIAVILFALPLVLGFTLSRDGLSPQAPMVLGASAQFTQINGTLHKTPLHKPIASNVHTNNQQQNGQGNGDNYQEHRHKHGHGHGHGHND